MSYFLFGLGFGCAHIGFMLFVGFTAMLANRHGWGRGRD